ncbi:ABC transporter permease [Eubacteriales bacterium OttesenSCG-928-N13]|nr:ABC transporter permease [Eubacteriales bacterium OttesenSCG-928-N13]
MRKSFDLKSFLTKNAVTIMFVLLCILCYSFSGYTLSGLIGQMVDRLTRNAFIVLALIIPIVAGMGINFAITIGAMAAQIALLWVMEWQIPGVQGFLVAALLTLPIATFFGYLVGKLLNQMKGQEMIGSLILGYFATGVYQLLFLFVFGNLIPMTAPNLVIKGSTGIANTLDLKPLNMMYALDDIWKLSFDRALYVVAGLFIAYALIRYLLKKLDFKALIRAVVTMVVICAAIQIPVVKGWFATIRIPMVTMFVIMLLCVFNVAIMRTKLGQNFRAVGQNGVVANAAGINVNRTRLIAIIFSTVLAGWGQLIFVQNMGSLQTYGAHEQVGLYAGAAILVGGASIVKATNGQALLGCLLFHLLFLVAPAAAKNVFGDPAIGEYFRVFVSYGVIAVALVMHAWSSHVKAKPENAIKEAGKLATDNT